MRNIVHESPLIQTDANRLWQAHEDMARHGATPKGGVNRQALTAEDGAARALFMQWAEDAGCSIETDAVGNIFARRPGLRPDLPAVATGSHLDTQPTGGKYDGAYGVLAGLEVVRALNDAGVRTERPIDVIVWCNEEGTRFAHAGSSVFAGKTPLEDAYGDTDADGVRFEDALTAIGAKGPLVPGARRFDSVFEAHIEQGPVLEAAGLPIGIVTGARGQIRFEVTVTGEEGHAGTMPMPMRRDALTAAARLTVRLEEIGLRYPPQGVCTVGALTVYPNSRNVIPGTVRFSIDLRHPTAEGLDAMADEIRVAMADERARGRVEVTCDILDREPPVGFDPEISGLLRDATVRVGHPAMDIFSMAGHDAVYVSDLQPTGMLFVPCAGGLSHNELEAAAKEDLAKGADVLATAMAARANRPVEA
jgi:N-carbamoyl-L-amino-acid hydrolase